MITLTELETRILEALSRYRFLTPSQLISAGVSNSKQVIWRALAHLRQYPGKKKALVGAIRFSPRVRIEAVETVHYLTALGGGVLAEALRTEEEAFDFKPVTSVYHRDYWHRLHTINFHIWLDQALRRTEFEIETWDRYFDKSGTNRTKDPNRPRLRSKTRLSLLGGRHLIPDVNFVVASRKDTSKKALFCLEVANGRDTKKNLRQIEGHVRAMKEGAMAAKYGVEQNHSSLFLFSQRALAESVWERFPEAASGQFESFFFLATTEAAALNPVECWNHPRRPALHHFITGAETPRVNTTENWPPVGAEA